MWAQRSRGRAQRLGNVQIHILKLSTSGTHTRLIPISTSPKRECVISRKEEDIRRRKKTSNIQRTHSKPAGRSRSVS